MAKAATVAVKRDLILMFVSDPFRRATIAADDRDPRDATAHPLCWQSQKGGFGRASSKPAVDVRETRAVTGRQKRIRIFVTASTLRRQAHS
jgi:hypothetical protein